MLKLCPDVQLAPGGGLTIKRSSVAGKNCSLRRTTNLSQCFASLSANIAATAPLNHYTDSRATNSGPYYYRIHLNS